MGMKPSREALVEYSGAASGPGTHRAEFRIVFDKPVELVGHMAAKLFMSAPMTTDMDVFVAVWKLDKEGNPVPFAYYAQYEDGPVSPPPRVKVVYWVGGVGMASCESSGVGYGEEYRVYAMVET